MGYVNTLYCTGEWRYLPPPDLSRLPDALEQRESVDYHIFLKILYWIDDVITWLDDIIIVKFLPVLCFWKFLKIFRRIFLLNCLSNAPTILTMPSRGFGATYEKWVIVIRFGFCIPFDDKNSRNKFCC